MTISLLLGSLIEILHEWVCAWTFLGICIVDVYVLPVLQRRPEVSEIGGKVVSDVSNPTVILDAFCAAPADITLPSFSGSSYHIDMLKCKLFHTASDESNSRLKLALPWQCFGFVLFYFCFRCEQCCYGVAMIQYLYRATKIPCGCCLLVNSVCARACVCKYVCMRKTKTDKRVSERLEPLGCVRRGPKTEPSG